MVEKEIKVVKTEPEPYVGFTYTFDETDSCLSKYGIKPIIRSTINEQDVYTQHWTSFDEINDELVGKKIKMRVRLQRSRIKGKGGFVVLRQGISTCQGVAFASEGVISAQMINFIASIPHESIIDIEATVVAAKMPVVSCSVSNYELTIETVFLVTACVKVLPFQLEDANRKGAVGSEDKVEEEPKIEEKKEEVKEEEVKEGEGADDEKKRKKKEEKERKKKEKEEKKAKAKEAQSQSKVNIVVNSNTRFDNRVLDMRTLSTNALMRLQSGVGRYFRDYCYKHDFVEIHTPKLIQGASEGGTNVFKFKYFGQEGCLAQSPQLFKQMAIIGGLEKVFEVAPVFRAENSNTGRHLCEFTMLDFEMTFKEHYVELIDMIYGLFVHIFDGLKKDYAHEFDVINSQYPFEFIEYSRTPVKLTYHEGVELLNQAGFKQDVNEDLDTLNEKKLGGIVKEKYGTDFYFLHKYPKSARPFYTMRDPEDNNFTNSYDAFIRGEEVLSGAQRINDYEELLKNVKEAGIDPMGSGLKDYVKAFQLGCPPHGGCGIGLERIVKLLTGFSNVKRCCMFPRDPKRLSP